MIPKFKTSERVTILDEDYKPLIKGAIVRGFNAEKEEYHLTLRSEKDGLEVIYARENRLLKE